MTGENKINYGLKDKPFFKESVPMLQSLPQPFYAHLITLTNHFPFYLETMRQAYSQLTRAMRQLTAISKRLVI